MPGSKLFPLTLLSLALSLAAADEDRMVAAQAASKFGEEYESNQEKTVVKRQNYYGAVPLSPKFFSHTLEQPIGQYSLNSIDFSTSRKINIPVDLRQERHLASLEEARLLARRDEESRADPADFRPSPVERPRGFVFPQEQPQPAFMTAYPASSQISSLQLHHRQSAYPVGVPGAHYAPPAPPAGYYPVPAPDYPVPVPVGPSPAPHLVHAPQPAYPVGVTAAPPLDLNLYNFNVPHGAKGGSYSYSTLGIA